jgi:acetylornithine/N-succinyldiaminopimelate aminotransferase
MLSAITGMEKMFFGNSGAEANECAIKIARKYSFDKYGKNRHTIITLKDSFHGRTLCTLSATGQEEFHNYFFPFVEGFVFADKTTQSVKEKLDGTVCAVMIEIVQGEGGVLPLENSFVAEIAEICKEQDVLLMVDEIQTGVGRSGKFLASQHYGIQPDIVTLAKGLAGGLPIGVCLASAKCADTLTAGTHGSTFGGNPVSCAGAVAVLQRIGENGFLDEVTKKAEYLREKLIKIPEVKDVTGLGLMVGIELKTAKAADVMKKAQEHGLLVLKAKDKVRLLPPLTVSFEEIDKCAEILEKVLMGNT